MVRILQSLIAAAAVTTAAEAASSSTACGDGYNNCPSSMPCCSQYGVCGTGAYCLGGCDPKHSFELGSCVARPQCKSGTYTFPNTDKIVSKTEYLGDSSQYDWVYDGQPLVQNDLLYLTMAPNTVGTVLASTTYVWYGKITAKIKTSRGRGVVTAFIMMSDVKDEIDYEWVGANLTTTQTNYYWQGVLDYHNTGNISLSDTFENEHTYELDWTPDSITWTIDGQVGRVKQRSDTYNSTTKSYMYPQTPARVQISLWPGGLASNGNGTIEWAGGLIDWNGEDIQQNGYYYATVSEVTVQCYDAPSDAIGSGTVSYEYADGKGLLEDSVELTNDPHILKSLLANGLNMTIDYPSSKSSTTVVTTSTNAAGHATVVTETVTPTESSVETVPGEEGAGFGSNDVGRGGSTSSSSSSSSSSDDSSDTSSSDGSSSTGFSQGTSSSSSSGKSGAVVNQPEHVVHGSMLAVVIAIIAMIAL